MRIKTNFLPIFLTFRQGLKNGFVTLCKRLESLNYYKTLLKRVSFKRIINVINVSFDQDNKINFATDIRQ